MIDHQVLADVSTFRTHSETVHYATKEAPQFVDITDEVIAVIRRSGVINGIVVVFSQHTTAAIKINEREPELLKDMSRFLAEVAPLDREYFHNDFTIRTVNMTEDECPNAHSHCQHLMLSASESVPLVAGQLQLGRWQRIFLIELDRAKDRQVTVQVLGI